MISGMETRDIFIYIGIVVLLFIIAMALKFKKSILFKVVFNFILGGAFIYGINALVKLLDGTVKVDLSIPFNPVTAAFAGYLQVPGIVLIYLIKYIIYPV